MELGLGCAVEAVVLSLVKGGVALSDALTQSFRINGKTLTEVFIRFECVNTWAKRGVHAVCEHLGERGVHTVFTQCSRRSVPVRALKSSCRQILKVLGQQTAKSDSKMRCGA